jgi:hypothetical protein
VSRVRWVPAVIAVVVRPRLWTVALVQLSRLAPTAWWRRPPFLPVPDRAWLHFRLVTAYGGDGRPPTPADVVAYLDWCRSYPSADA